ncbi:MAG: NADH-quinone oxidoreductase subunit N [Planctomycetes bacterium]|nr:NADH-quinone oxidoreductase subunit N [Planctomycetota bacterium]
MNLTDVWIGVQRLGPEAGLTVLILLVVIADLICRRDKFPVGMLALGGTAALTVFAFRQFDGYSGEAAAVTFQGAAVSDAYSLFFRVVFLVAAVVVILFSMPVISRWSSGRGEFFALILSCTLGMCLMAVAGDLLMMYLSLEFVSITSYVLAGMLPRNRKSAEASLKYIIYGAGASGMMIYAMSYLYGVTGTLKVDEIGRALTQMSADGSPMPQTMTLVVSVLVMAGFGYKIAAVPFHMWCPDVYEGAPTPVTAFFSIGPKAAGFAMLGRFIAGIFQTGAGGTPDFHWNFVLAGLAVATMAVGNLAALQQQNLKRLMAYSSIGHAGYLLLGFTVFKPENMEAILFYVVAYLVMNLGAFLVIIVMEEKYGIETVEQCRGLGWRAPGLCVAMTVFLFSLTGLPPTAGFMGKLLIFGYLVKSMDRLSIALAVAGVLFSVVSLYYYARIFAAMFLVKPRETEPAAVGHGPMQTALLGALGALTLVLGVAPSLVLKWAHEAVEHMVPRM